MIHVKGISEMDAKRIYLNLPIEDVNRTKHFWSELGFKIDENFTGGETVAVVLIENLVYALFSEKRRFAEFTNRKTATDETTQVLLAVDVESRAKVDEIIEIAVKNGAKKYLQAEDHGWMYFDRFIDLDGHQWEILFSDLTLLENK